MMAGPSCNEQALLLAEAKLEENFCAHVIPIEINRPRTILSVKKDEFLVFQRGSNEVMRVSDTNGDDIPDQIESVGAKGGNHGMAYNNGFIYISSDSTVWRWKYDLGDSAVSSERETVVINIDKDGRGGAPNGHTTRTLIFDNIGRLYISVGSAGNVDSDSHRSRIRRMTIADQSLPIDFQKAEVFADGLRNEVGLAFDKHGVLWGVENGADNLKRSDLGGDIHNDNPAEELNRFPEFFAGSHWGYPECWSEYLLPKSVGLGRGTQWSWPSFSTPDAVCREERIPPELAMQAHSAPLGITFYKYASELPAGCSGSFPEFMDGYAFIAFHGSWNRDIPTGYKVVYVKMTDDGFINSTDPHDLLARDSNDAQWSSGYRPVDVDFDVCGRLLVTSDGSRGGRGSNVVRISYNNNNTCCGSVFNSASLPSPHFGSALIFVASLVAAFFH
uniref:Pyrroloquinoline quinone-dependent pyranose dehydrogenase beta-propeller domain-containing protein n=2 Tax=Ditylum brightwellii TaxID=49249 RepID=A0A7S4SZ02_9STRA